MRIISGQFKGHKLVPFKNPHIRPTTDREKESIFNTLMGQIEGAYVLDLFAGTGSLGLEALSRGASRVCCVDKNPKSIEIIWKNHQKLKIKKGMDWLCVDIFKFLKNNFDKKFDLVLADPPFTQKLAHKTMQALEQSKAIHEEAWVILESNPREYIEKNYRDFNILKQKKFKDKIISFYKRGSFS